MTKGHPRLRCHLTHRFDFSMHYTTRQENALACAQSDDKISFGRFDTQLNHLPTLPYMRRRLFWQMVLSAIQVFVQLAQFVRVGTFVVSIGTFPGAILVGITQYSPPTHLPHLTFERDEGTRTMRNADAGRIGKSLPGQVSNVYRNSCDF